MSGRRGVLSLAEETGDIPETPLMRHPCIEDTLHYLGDTLIYIGDIPM